MTAALIQKLADALEAADDRMRECIEWHRKFNKLPEMSAAIDHADKALAEARAWLETGGWLPMSNDAETSGEILGLLNNGTIEICEFIKGNGWRHEEIGENLFKRVEYINSYWNTNKPLKWQPLPPATQPEKE